MSDDNENQNPYSCAAYGCPLHGTISHSTTGGDQWYCASHFGVRPEDSDQVTQKIRANHWLIKLAQRIQRLSPFDWDKARPQAEAYVRQHHRPDLVLEPDESRGKYAYRLIAAFGVLVAPTPIHREIRQEQRKPDSDQPALLADLLAEAA